MTVYPAPSPSKGPNWKVIIPVVIIVVLICICLIVAGILVYMGTQGKGPLAMLAPDETPTDVIIPDDNPDDVPTQRPIKSPTQSSDDGVRSYIIGTWNLFYDWSCTGDYSGPATITFYEDGSFSIYEESSDSAYGTWSVDVFDVSFIFDESPFSTYEGLWYEDDTMDGTMDNNEGSSGCWYAFQGAYDGGGPDAYDITGDWELFYDWNCDGGYSGPATITYYNDASFYLSEGTGSLTGIWFTSSDYVEFFFDEDPHAFYTGTIFSSTYMEGEMTTDEEQSGCWYAER